VRPRGQVWHAAWRLQLYVLAISLPVAFVGYASLDVVLVLILLHVLALILFGTTPIVLRWMWLTLRSALWPADERKLAARIPRTE